MTEAGLYPKEAEAMVKTWQDSRLEEDGLRVLSVLSVAWTDRALPGEMPEMWRRGAPRCRLAFGVCVALLNDKGAPIARSHPEFETDWKQALAVVEIGDALPHWRVAVYHLNYGQFVESNAQTAGLPRMLFVMLVVAIGVGNYLISADIHRQLKLARQERL